MVLLSDIKGQGNAVKFLTGCLKSERIPNAFLFSGPEGVGRALAAKAFMAELFCKEPANGRGACGVCAGCRRVFSLEHPDILWLRPEKNKNIPIEEIRGAKDRLNLKPYESRYNVCVMEEAHMVKPEAANAMLKLLEEPPAGALLILISSKKELLLPTVVSRCSEVKFRYLSLKDTSEIVAREGGADEYTASFLASFSQGAPGKALEMMKDGLVARRDALALMLQNVAASAEAAFLSWDSESKDTIIEDIEIMLMFLRDAVLAKEGLHERVLDKRAAKIDAYGFLKGYTLDKIYDITERLIGLKQALYGNVNPKIVAQALPALLK